MDVAKEISRGLADRIVIAKVVLQSLATKASLTLTKVNGEVWDLERPLEGSCKLELLDFEHPEGDFGEQTSWPILIATLKGSVCSGTHRLTSSAKLQNVTTGAICASALQLKTVSSTRWP